MKNQVKQCNNRWAPPPEQTLVFDEAQRAYHASMVAEKHKLSVGDPGAKSEPEHFIEFASCVPDWWIMSA